MSASSRSPFRITAGLALVGFASPALAADAGRADLLAAEAARFSTVPGAEGAGSWLALGLLLAGTMIAAFAGSIVASRRKVALDPDGNHREVTFRLGRKEPLRLKTDTLGRLAEVLDDLEDIGAGLKSGSTAASAGTGTGTGQTTTPAPVHRRQVREVTDTIRERAQTASPSGIPSASRRGERRSAYERARALLAEGQDPAVVAEVTGLKAAEIDLLRTAPAAAAPIRRERLTLNVGPSRPVFRREAS